MSKDLKEASKPCDYLKEQLIQRKRERKGSAMGTCHGGWSLVSKRKGNEEVREVLMENWGREVSNRVVLTGL